MIQEKGTGSIKRLFVDDVESMELLQPTRCQRGFANTVIPVVVYTALFFVDWKLALMSLASLPAGLLAMMVMYRIGQNGW